MVQEIEGRIPNPPSRRFFPAESGAKINLLRCYDNVSYLEAGIISSFYLHMIAYIFTCFIPINT